MSMGNTINTITVPVTPIGATPQWIAAVAAAGGQCQHEQAKGRCGHTQSGGYRLYLHTDDQVYCDTHISGHQAADNPAPRSRRAGSRGQGGPDLFDLLAELDADGGAA